VPETSQRLAEQIVGAVRALRAMQLRKPPSIAETIDWARTMLALGVDSLDQETMAGTLGVVLKHQADQARAAQQLPLTPHP